ncbi:MAG TPA: DHA2 family efflux MFS transporter permease subunit [Methylophilaceae bacterium]|nr:DHA2 family efflux MFS transporter permease subunit [Methylophilaceae bacterium]
MVHSIEESKRWLALIILCLGELMIVLDTTIVNVALPSIRSDLAFTESALVWVVNAYMLTFGGFLLLGGRLGDLFGQRKLFLFGIILFTGASLACGIANSQAMLIIARGIQGLGGAVVSAVALSLIMSLFTESGERAKAMGIYGFVCAGGGSVGVLLGGVLTSMLSWHWIFLVNLPIGIAVYGVCLRILPPGEPQTDVRHMDIGGALTITASLMLTVYAIVNGHAAGWLSPMTGSLLGASLLLLIAFLVIESRVHRPLVPLRFFRLRNVSIANVIAALWAAAMFAWFFISALYMQLVLGYDAMQVGLAFLPSNLIMAILSLGLSARIVMRFGIRPPLMGGLMLGAIGLGLFAFAPLHGHFMQHVLPGMLLLGLGAGIAFNPLLLAAMSDVSQQESGLASGIVNTAFMMGGALGLAILASAAVVRTDYLMTQGTTAMVALNSGYQAAFALGGLAAGIAALLGFCLNLKAAPVDNALH